MSRGTGTKRRHRRQEVGATVLDRLLSRIRREPSKPLASFYSALEMIARGCHPGEAEWRDLADVVNCVETLMLAGHLLHSEVAPVVAASTEAMAAAAQRFRAGAGVRLDAGGLQAMRELLATCEDCVADLPPEVMEAARRATADRVRAYRNGKATGVQVIAV